jgi:HAD superfamily hydrolase (TIGR01509 family)
MLFDLDGTLIDSVYQHVLAWHETLEAAGIGLSVWRIHRRIGMSGGLFIKALEREVGRPIADAEAQQLRDAHADAYVRRLPDVKALPGARELLGALSGMGVPWAIATSGSDRTARPALALLGVAADAPLVTRDQVSYAKPNPDLFLAAADRLGADPRSSFVVGDSIWDLLAAQRAGSLGIGVLSGGYGREELESAGAYRVYEDPAALLGHLDELGIRSS